MLRGHGIQIEQHTLIELFYTRFMALCVLYRALNNTMLVRCCRLIYDSHSDTQKMVACIVRVNRQIHEKLFGN